MKTIIFILTILLLTGCCSNNQYKLDEPDKKVVRKGAVIKVKPEMLKLYKELHANPWEGVNNKLKECNIQNYSIFHREGYLFSYFEYTGDNWELDMEKLAADSTIRAWWKLTDPCQEPTSFAKDGEWWADLGEVYHLE